MIIVTLPNGREYRYNDRREAAAQDLARRTGATIVRPRRQTVDYGDALADARRDAAAEDGRRRRW